MEDKPVKPPEHKQRYGGGRITRDKNGLYIGRNPLILETFNVDETVYVLSPGSFEHLNDSLIYYMDLYINQTQHMSGVIDGLMEVNHKLREENDYLKKELQCQKTLKDFTGENDDQV